MHVDMARQRQVPSLPGTLDNEKDSSARLDRMRHQRVSLMAYLCSKAGAKPYAALKSASKQVARIIMSLATTVPVNGPRKILPRKPSTDGFPMRLDDGAIRLNFDRSVWCRTTILGGCPASKASWGRKSN